MLDNRVRYSASVQILQSTIRPLNPQFSLCDVLVCCHGDNTNRTTISKEAINNALFSIYGIPIVGEWARKDDGSKTWGSHGGRIVVDDNGVRWEETTKPFGFVTEEAARGATWVMVTEPDGTRREYLKLSGCVLWTGRYEECKSILEKNFGQSMEIEMLETRADRQGFTEILRFLFSALCVLGTAQPCFPSASIGRHYARGIERDVKTMLDAYKQFSKEDNGLNENLTAALAGIMLEKRQRYALLSADEQNAYVIDRQDYKAYAVPYTAGEDGNIALAFDAREERPLGVGDAANEFSIHSEMEPLIAQRVKTLTDEVVEELNAKLLAKDGEYAALNAKYEQAQAALEQHEQAKAAQAHERHVKAVDAKIAEYASHMGQFSEYLLYRSKVDYSKAVEQIDTDLTLLLGRYNKRKKAGFQAIVTETAASAAFEGTGAGRYGNLFDKVQK